MDFPGSVVLRNPSAGAGDRDARDLGRSPGVGNANCSIALTWRIPWTEEAGGLQSWGSRVEPD